MTIGDRMTWVELPFVDEPLDSADHVGNGKDAEFELRLGSGLQVTLAATHVRVEIDGHVDVQVSSEGDLSLRISYRGEGLYLRRGRVGWPEEDGKWPAEFREDAQAWVAGGCEGDLLWAPEVEIRLGSS